MFASWETAWIFSRGNTGPMSIKSESSKVHCDLLERDCGRISPTMEEKGKTSSSTTIHSVSLLFFLFPLAISLVFFCLYPSCLQAGTVHTVDLMRLGLAIVSVSLWHTAHCFPSLQHRVKYPSSIHRNHMARAHYLFTPY